MIQRMLHPTVRRHLPGGRWRRVLALDGHGVGGAADGPGPDGRQDKTLVIQDVMDFRASAAWIRCRSSSNSWNRICKPTSWSRPSSATITRSSAGPRRWTSSAAVPKIEEIQHYMNNDAKIHADPG